MRILCTRHTGSFHGESIIESSIGRIGEDKGSGDGIGYTASCLTGDGSTVAPCVQHSSIASRIKQRRVASSVVQGFPFREFGPFSAQQRRVKDRVQLTCSRSRVEGSPGRTQRSRRHADSTERQTLTAPRISRAGRRRGHIGRGLPVDTVCSTAVVCTVAAVNWIGGCETRLLLLLRHPETADCRRSDQRPAQRARHRHRHRHRHRRRHKRAAAIFCASCACAPAVSVCASPVDTDTQTHRHLHRRLSLDADTRAPQPPQTRTTKRKRQSLLRSCLLPTCPPTRDATADPVVSSSTLVLRKHWDIRSPLLLLLCPSDPRQGPRCITSWTSPHQRANYPPRASFAATRTTPIPTPLLFCC
jgi:hypothetical protein